jgi:pSer/pThr/pTyr-binding forkhead associated (FHA) protein
MLQLKVLSGKMAGTEMVARHFPFSIGRAASNDFVLEESAAFDRHLTIALAPEKQFVLQTSSGAFVALSGEQNVRQAALKNSDQIDIGQTRILVCLSPTRQKKLAKRELLVWVALAFVTALQCWLIFWLSQGPNPPR